MIELSSAISKIQYLITTNKLIEAFALSEQTREKYPDSIDCLFFCGSILLQLKRFEEASKFLIDAISRGSTNPIIYFNLAVVYENLNNENKALNYYDSAIEYQSNYLEAYFNRGNLYKKKGQYHQAIKDIQKVIYINPNLAQAYGILGNIFKEMGDYDQALLNYSKTITLNPQLLESFFNRGKIYFEKEIFKDAISDFIKVTEINPMLLDAHYFLGVCYKNIKNYEYALNHFNNVIDLNKNHIDSLIERADILVIQENYQAAINDLNQAISCNPNLAEPHHNLGLIFEKIHQFNNAIDCYTTALLLKENSAETYNNLGNVFRETGSYDKSITSFKTAISIRPNYAEAFNNLGWTFNIIREINLSIENLRKAIELNKDLPEAHFNLALSYLAQGNYLDGFSEYEWRKKLSTVAYRNLSSPLWIGKESIANQTIFIYCEQGLGDTIHFCRYCKLLSKMGAKVILEVQEPLYKLLINLEGVSQVIITGDEIPFHNFHAPLMSLPLAFNTDLSSIPHECPYIAADHSKVKFWADRIAMYTRLRVGLVWSGGFRKNQPELWTVNSRRNIPFAEISKINTSDIDFFCLQKGDPAVSELKTLKSLYWTTDNFIDFTNELNDFSDTAALIENLDLVISVDTSVAHLAGALNKPVWLLNRRDTCWRWANQEKSLWYPTISIFDQVKNGEWGQVITNVIAKLNNLKK
jgi:hypothetical protein